MEGSIGFACVKGGSGRPGKLLVCADGWVTIVPSRDAHGVPRSGIAGTTAGCKWNLAAGNDPRDGRSHRAGAIQTRTGATLGACDDPGTPGEAIQIGIPTGDGL